MSLNDLLLKAKVNMALVRDPRVSSLDIGVSCVDGRVTLSGDVDTQRECDSATEIARGVDGVRSVQCDMTFGVGKQEETAELVTQRFLSKLDEGWDSLPDQNALTQADYLRWALWMIYKFRLPESVAGEERGKLQAEAEEQALANVAGHVGAPKSLLAFLLLQQAESVAQSPSRNAPDIDNPLLVATPVVQGDEERTAVPSQS